ncbi:hypothetical protein AB0R12_17070 [Streptomyces niveus]|uniref:hypothetical protein n=1 Tax=Streptomyces niveus TaxID=193462 RepID=UPI00344AB8E7
MRTLLFGEVYVHYGQMYVVSDPDGFDCDLHEAFAGQEGGLCGGATPGALFLVTALHTGQVGLTVELHDEPPPLDPLWEEVVEVPFRPLSDGTRLAQWAHEDSWELDLDETDYRVRYSARGMDEARVPENFESPEPVDHYLLQFWPCPPSPARVVRQTSDHAAYWHAWARELPPPPPRPTPEEVAEAASLAERERERERLAEEARTWGGQVPSERLRSVGGNVWGMIRLDAALLHALDAAGPDVQRAVARLVARRACTAAGLAGLDWVAASLESLDRGGELAPPFDGRLRQVFDLLRTDERVPQAVVEVPLSRTAISRPHLAVPAVFAAAERDPLLAAVDALFAAASTYGADYGALFDEVRPLLEPRGSDT